MRSLDRFALALALVGLVAASACSTPPQTMTAEDVLAAMAPVSSSVAPGALVFVVFHVRAPARSMGELASGSSAVVVPEHLRLEHPHRERIERNGAWILQEYNPKSVNQFDPHPPRPPRAPDEEAPEVVYAALTAEPRVFIATGNVSIGWTGVASRVLVRPCSHGKRGHVDLVVENDVLDRQGAPVCLETAWFPGVDTIYSGAGQRCIVTGDPGRDGVPLVVVRAAN